VIFNQQITRSQPEYSVFMAWNLRHPSILICRENFAAPSWGLLAPMKTYSNMGEWPWLPTTYDPCWSENGISGWWLYYITSSSRKRRKSNHGVVKMMIWMDLTRKTGESTNILTRITLWNPGTVISAINMYEHFMFFTISGVLKLPTWYIYNIYIYVYIVQFFQKWAKKPPSFGLTCPFVFWGEKVTANLHFEWQFQAHFPTGNLTSNLSQLG